MISILELRGKKIVLEKLNDKEGRTSKVKPGKKQEIILMENPTTGYELLKKRFSRHRDEVPNGVRATSKFLKVLNSNEETGVYVIETENSIYQITVI